MVEAQQSRVHLGPRAGRDELVDELARLQGGRIVGGSERVRPVVPRASERHALGVSRGVACFAIERLATTAVAPR